MKVPGETYRPPALPNGDAATCKLDGDAKAATLYYPRNTKFGRRILKNERSERAIIANYIRQEKGWPRGIESATPINFVAI
jgi:hypothetical protein